MNAEQIQMARQALGLSVRKKSYRNCYSLTERAPAMALWQQMVANGDAVLERVAANGMHHFKMTLKGAQIACEPGEILSSEEFPSVGTPEDSSAANTRVLQRLIAELDSSIDAASDTAALVDLILERDALKVVLLRWQGADAEAANLLDAARARLAQNVAATASPDMPHPLHVVELCAQEVGRMSHGRDACEANLILRVVAHIRAEAPKIARRAAGETC